GYCMGGTLSVMFTALHPDKVKNLILMAAGLDFEADQGLLRFWAKREYFDANKLVDTVGNVPGEFLNFGFLLLNPVNNLYSKYVMFTGKADNEEFVRMFFRMEKWIIDGIPLAGEAYREFMKKCYQQNLLVKSQLELDGKRVYLNKLTMPVLNIVAQYDNLVPPESSMSFTDLIPSKDKKLMLFKTGHIGLSVSSAAHAKMWPQVSEWLRERSSVKGEEAKPPKQKGVSKKSSTKKSGK
ncbi:MAG: alpha/beta fold hydrolase, partial [Thermoplasmata archaeon]|nr:alpha/beta fold hydrolase [Thermoplasmata archaeon]